MWNIFIYVYIFADTHTYLFKASSAKIKILFFSIFLFFCDSLYCTWQILHFFFYKLKVEGNPVSSKAISTIFPITFAHFTSLYHNSVIFQILQAFSLLLYLLWFDQWQLTESLDDGSHFLVIKYVLILVCTLFFFF